MSCRALKWPNNRAFYVKTPKICTWFWLTLHDRNTIIIGKYWAIRQIKECILLWYGQCPISPVIIVLFRIAGDFPDKVVNDPNFLHFALFRIYCFSDKYLVDQTIQHCFIKLPDHSDPADFVYKKPDITVLSISFMEIFWLILHPGFIIRLLCFKVWKHLYK